MFLTLYPQFNILLVWGLRLIKTPLRYTGLTSYFTNILSSTPLHSLVLCFHDYNLRASNLRILTQYVDPSSVDSTKHLKRKTYVLG